MKGTICSPCLKGKNLQRLYGITLDDHAAMLEAQEARCGICGEERPLVVDHHHASGRVRKLLCRDCNVGLGHFKDRPDVLRLAAEYLEAN